MKRKWKPHYNYKVMKVKMMSAGLSIGGLVAEGRMPLVVGCCSLALGRLNSGLWVI